MADENNITNPTDAATAGDASTASAAPANDDDGAMSLERPSGTTITPVQAEIIRRQAYERATGKAQGEGSKDTARTDAGHSDDDDDGEFDQDNGVDADGEPIAKPAASKPAAPAKNAPATPEARAELVKATRALRLDGYSDEDIAELSPAAIVRLGQKAGERHARTAAALREAAEIRKSRQTDPNAHATDRAGNRSGRVSSQSTTTTDGQRAQQVDRLDALLAELEGEAAPESDPEAAPPANSEEVETLRQQLAERDDRLNALELDRGLKGAYGLFPQLRGKEARSAVVRRMGVLDPEGKAIRDHQALAQLIRDAAYIEFGPQLSEAARQASIDKARLQRDGQPDAATSNREPSRKLTAEQKRRAAYETARAGSPEEARRAYLAKVNES